MYLLSMSNVDYAMMTILFAILAVTSYIFRRKNNSSKDFLILQSHTLRPFYTILSLSGIGLPEFLFFSSIAAFFGLSAICALIPIFLLVTIYFDKSLNKSIFATNILSANKTSIEQRSFYIIYGLILIFMSGVAISMMVGLLKSLLGWEFGNSTLSLMAVVAVCILLGGVISVYYNHATLMVILSAILSIVLFIAYQKLGFGNLIKNLHAVAQENNLPIKTFTALNFSTKNITNFILLIFAIFTLLVISPLNLVKAKKSDTKSKSILVSSRFLQLIILVGVLLVGVFALATPNNTKNIAGSRLITQQTRLDDGSMGFVVKAVPSDAPTMQRGLIPQNMPDNSFTGKFSNQELTSTGFDYLSSALVLIKHSLPFAFVSLIVVIILFYKTMSECISFITLLAINGFYAPYYNKTGDEYENLWATRVFMFMFMFVAIAVGLVLFKYFDVTFLGGVTLLLAIFPALYLLGLRVNMVFSIILLIITVLGVCFQNIENIPSLLPLLKFPDWWTFIICWGFMIVVLQIVFTIISKFFTKSK